MLNTKESPRHLKNAAYTAFADVTKALSSPRRLELLDLLVQAPRTVDDLARAVGRPVGSTSQHLQVLKRARVVQTRRHGTWIEYRLAPGVAEVFAAVRRLAELQSPALRDARDQLHADMADGDEPRTIDARQLRQHLDAGDATLLDVRPAAEFEHGHIPGAISAPLARLEALLPTLPADSLLVATCRGPYCVDAAAAVRLLRAHGRRAVRFEQGVAEWALDGGRIARGRAA